MSKPSLLCAFGEIIGLSVLHSLTLELRQGEESRIKVSKLRTLRWGRRSEVVF
jgi:hypothetical protein